MIPPEIIIAAEREMKDMSHGVLTIICSAHDLKFKYRIVTEKSYIPGKPTSGSQPKK